MRLVMLQTSAAGRGEGNLSQKGVLASLPRPLVAQKACGGIDSTHPHPPTRSDINDRQRRLAEITEMIHTASLVHDDVLDDCDTRRGELRLCWKVVWWVLAS
eukprot:scaffold218497_cov22-Tisochrysis_lutea.AAC.1